MKEDIINLATQIKMKNHCACCGGNFSSDATCRFCGVKSDEMEYLLLQLDKKLSQLPDDFLGGEKAKLNKCLTSLYYINEIGNSNVTDILNAYEYFDTILFVKSFVNIPNYLQGNINLSKDGYDFIYKAYMYNDVKEEDKFLYSSILAKAILEKNGNLELNDVEVEQFFVAMVNSISDKILGERYVKAELSNVLGDHVLGDISTFLHKDYLFGKIRIDKNLLKRNPYEVFPTVFHELIHEKQDIDIKKKKELSLKNLVEIKDIVLTNSLEGYYKQNYNREVNYISFEQEAFIGQYKESIDCFHSMGVVVPSKFEEEFNRYYHLFGNFVESKTRIYNHVFCDVDELFQNTIVNTPKIIDTYPQLAFEYKVVNGQVLPKNIDDIMRDYNAFKDGKIKWNSADGVDVSLMYEKKIQSMKESKNK